MMQGPPSQAEGKTFAREQLPIDDIRQMPGVELVSWVIEENVLASRGLKTMRAAETYLREAGFEPRRRKLSYELYEG